MMEVFQNSPQPLCFTAFVVVSLLSLVPVSLHVPLDIICLGFCQCFTSAAGAAGGELMQGFAMVLVATLPILKLSP